MATPDAALPFKCVRGAPRHDAILLLLLLLLLHPLASTSAFVPGPTVRPGSSLSRTMPIRYAAARAGEVAAIQAPTTPFVDDLPIWPVPASIRREEPLGGPEPSYVKFLGLAEVFEAQDGAKLADLFDTDSVFRCVMLFPVHPQSPPPASYRPLTCYNPTLLSQARHTCCDARRLIHPGPDPFREGESLPGRLGFFSSRQLGTIAHAICEPIPVSESY